MNAVGQVLATLFSRPRLTWAALALTAGALLLLPASVVGTSADQSFAASIRFSTWALLCLALAFLTLTIGLDIAKSVSKRLHKASEASAILAQFYALPDDAKAILKYLALNSENSLWLPSDHLGVYPLRRAGFVYIATNRGEVCEIETKARIFDWMQQELDIVGGCDLPDSVRDRLIDAIEAAHKSLGTSWMAL